MKLWSRDWLVVLAVLAATASGCAGKSPLDLFGRRPPGPSSASPSSVAPAAAPASESLAQKVSNSLSIQPKRIAAEDPVRLSSQPGSLGPEVYLHAARLQESKGNIEAALEQYRKALEQTPHDVATLVRYGRLCQRQGRVSEAVEMYQRAMEADPKNALPRNDLGLCHARRGELQEAEYALQEAVELQPESTLYRNNLALVLVQAGQTDKALPHLLAVHPPAVAHYNLGLLLKRGEQLDQARLHFTLATEHNPEFGPAHEILQQLGGPVQTARSPHAGPARRVSQLPADRRSSPPIEPDRSSGAQSFISDAPGQDPRRLLPPVIQLENIEQETEKRDRSNFRG